MKTYRQLIPLLIFLLSPLAFAQTFPTKPVRIIIPYAPGGVSDTLARLIAGDLTERWQHQVIVDNRPGGNTIIGTNITSKAPADGYTMLITDPSFATNPSLYSKLPYNPRNDFEPVTVSATIPLVLVLHPSLTASSVAELIARAKANPNQLSYASAGIGSSTHMAPEIFSARAGIKMTHVPYKGGGQAIADVLSGQVPIFFVGISTVLQHIKANRLRAAAVTSIQRSKVLPDVPTIAESGFPGYEITSWQGVFTPAGVSGAIIRKLQMDIAAAGKSPDVASRMAALGAEPVGMPPEQFRNYLKVQTELYAKAIRAAGIEAK